MLSWMLAFVVSLGAAAPLPAATWPVSVATCPPDAGSSHYRCPQADPALVEMFAKAQAHDVAGVRSASARIKTGTDESGMIDTAYVKFTLAFALAVADPKTYEREYVRAFVRTGYVGYDLLDRINRAGLAPSPFDIITRRAAAGDGMAYAAIIGANAPLNEFHPPFNGPLNNWKIAHNNGMLFAAMAAAGPEPVASYLCTQQHAGRDPNAGRRTIARLKATTPKGRALVAQLKALLANCSEYDPDF